MKRSASVPVGMLRLVAASAGVYLLVGCGSSSSETEQPEELVSEEFSPDNFPPPGTGLVTTSGAVVEAPDISDKKEVENDAYTPAVGYYHAPCNQWFPHPWNYYEEGKGYFQCGQWLPQPSHPTVIRSYPSYHSVHYARSMWMGSYGYHNGSSGWSFGRPRDATHYGSVSNFSPSRPRPTTVSNFSGSSHSSSGSTSHVSSSGSGSSSSSTSRGGFGSSGSSFSSGS